MAGLASKIFGVVKRLWPGFAGGIVFAMLCFVGINAAMEPVSSSEYCGSRCHEMNTAYRSWEVSVHGSNQNGVTIDCVDCHLPPKEKYFTHLAVKGYKGAVDIYNHYFGGEYDAEKFRALILETATNDMCTVCHDKLLAKPSNSSARIAHAASLSEPDEPENRCVKCHEDTGHKRNSKLFSP